ncbi:MAG: hypothetical protein PQJ49_07170 [Sphaerochaetaceae bacterium]|nr:hypothetical protein [Sphaerochaetaceae bacterium]MDC7237023.1 hypothetical protein [Sphaerochaetaceae bacterium]MDC7249676.1 hypothetical protein [Sphaerochaetaceae bacterium]
MKDCTKLVEKNRTANFYFNSYSSQLSLAETFYKLAKSFLDKKDLVKGLDCYCDTFLLRNTELESLNDDFLEFFKIQFIIYLLGKKKIKVALSEGDMVYDLIEDSFRQLKEEIESSPFAILDKNRRSFYKSVEIDFPWMLFEDSIFA